MIVREREGLRHVIVAMRSNKIEDLTKYQNRIKEIVECETQSDSINEHYGFIKKTEHEINRLRIAVLPFSEAVEMSQNKLLWKEHELDFLISEIQETEARHISRERGTTTYQRLFIASTLFALVLSATI